jgi:multicomponent Na+:H+ antiporter subunit E
MARVRILLLLMAAAWLLWSGYFDKPLLLGLGAFSVILVTYVARRMDLVDHDVFPVHYGLRIIGYWFWLLKEIVKSNLDVARLVLHPRLPISPTVTEIEALTDDENAQVLLGNSITLTPGTVTLDIHEGRLLVHALTRDGAAALDEGEMNRRVAALLRRD